MAKCPKCRSAQDWWSLLQFDKTQLMVCRSCGSKLALDSERTTVLIGGLLALIFFPETGLLPFDIGILWFLGVLIIYMPFYLSYLKLNLVNHEDINVTANQKAEFAAYTKGRKKIKTIGNIIFLLGFVVFFGGISVASVELVPVIGLLSISVGLGMLTLTRCPFCKKITLRNPIGSGGRCMNCHREIDINQ